MISIIKFPQSQLIIINEIFYFSIPNLRDITSPIILTLNGFA